LAHPFPDIYKGSKKFAIWPRFSTSDVFEELWFRGEGTFLKLKRIGSDDWPVLCPSQISIQFSKQCFFFIFFLFCLYRCTVKEDFHFDSACVYNRRTGKTVTLAIASRGKKLRTFCLNRSLPFLPE